MLCQNCQKKAAKVHFTHIVNDNKVEVFLCDDCAREKSKININMPMDLSTFITSFMGFNNETVNTERHSGDFVCQVCRLGYSDFKKTGKVGCSNCYEAFKEKLGPVLKRIHGSDTHTGKIPAKLSSGIKLSREIKELKNDLNKAVRDEEYEKAAEIRDRIKILQSAGEGG